MSSELNLKEVSMSKMILHLKAAIEARNTAMIHGSPGIGKSEMIENLAKEMEFEVIHKINLASKDPVDTHGLPMIEKTLKEVEWTRPYFIPANDDNRKTLLFFDEVNAAARSVQATIYGILHERRVEKWDFSDKNVAVIAAGNKIDDDAIVHEGGTALNTRMKHIYAHVDSQEFYEWGVTDGKGRIHNDILAYLLWRMDMVYNRPNREEFTYPNPRTWEKLSREMNTPTWDNMMGNEDKRIACNGYIGESGNEFMAFIEYKDKLPSKKDILDYPETAKIPSITDKITDDDASDYGALYALTEMLRSMVAEEGIPFENLYPYINRIPSNFTPILVKFFFTSPQLKELKKNKIFRKWVSDNSDILQKGDGVSP